MGSVVIAALPWNLADMMSIQVAGLKSFLLAKGIEARGCHFYLDTARYFSDDEIECIQTRLLGEHLFGAVLFPESWNWIAAKLRDQSDGLLDPESCRERVSLLVEDIVDELAQCDPDLIGFTTTHMQYLSSIAVAKAVKERLPGTKVVLGGLALHGEPAWATLSVFPWIDYVIVGEGESPLWRLVQHIRGQRPLADVPQLVHRTGSGIEETGGIESITTIADLPEPDYSDYFHRLGPPGALVPRATIEMSRGCRWGRCSFCIEGLPSRGGFRKKSPVQVAHEVESLVAKHRILDFVTSDPDVAFDGPSFGAVRNLGLDVRFMVELSGLVRFKDFDTMIESGVDTVQIGIESFSPRLLKAFNKGVSLTKYVQLMRRCAERGITLVYNNICNAPFETQADLDAAVENMKRLFFFQPPRLSDFRVSIGSSIYQDYANYGIKRLIPSEEVLGYPDQVANGVGMLISFHAGWGFEREPEYPELDHTPYLCILDEWRAIWKLKPRRVARRGRGFVRVDHTIGGHRYTVTIEHPLQSALFIYCQQLRRRSELERRFEVSDAELDAAIEWLWESHLLFKDGNEYVSLVALLERPGG